MSPASGPARAGDGDQEVIGVSDLGFGPGPVWTDGEAGPGAEAPSDAEKKTPRDPEVEQPEAAGEPEVDGESEASGEPEAAGQAEAAGQPEAAGEVEAGGEPEATGEEADEVAQLRRERDEYLRMLQQVQADFENYRKRVLRQADDSAARATEALLERLLPVLDTVELARAHAVDSAVEQVASALFELL